jgi:hypothetical protein
MAVICNSKSVPPVIFTGTQDIPKKNRNLATFSIPTIFMHFEE